MKKLFRYVFILLSLVFIIPTQLKAENESNPALVSPTKTVESAEATVLLARLEKIDAMDKSTMSFSEKKKLRKEVRAINKNLTELGGGVYLSVGGIIIIILLLILLL